MYIDSCHFPLRCLQTKYGNWFCCSLLESAWEELSLEVCTQELVDWGSGSGKPQSRMFALCWNAVALQRNLPSLDVRSRRRVKKTNQNKKPPSPPPKKTTTTWPCLGFGGANVKFQGPISFLCHCDIWKHPPAFSPVPCSATGGYLLLTFLCLGADTRCTMPCSTDTFTRLLALLGLGTSKLINPKEADKWWVLLCWQNHPTDSMWDNGFSCTWSEVKL